MRAKPWGDMGALGVSHSLERGQGRICQVPCFVSDCVVTPLLQCHCAVPRIRGRPSQRALGWVLTCAFLLWTESAPGFFHPDTALCLQPLGPQRGHSRLCSQRCPVWVFISRVCCGVSFSAPGGHSLSCCPWGFQSLHLQLTGVTHGLAVSVWTSVGWPGDHQEDCTPTTCARNSGGAPVPSTCSGCGRPLHRLGWK